MNVATGFLVVIVAVLVGYVCGRIKLLGEQAGYVLSRLVFYVLAPFLLFFVLSQADVKALFSSMLVVSALSAAGVMGIYAVVARISWRRTIGETVIGAYSAGYTNAANIGIPISLYLLGSAAYPAPVTLVQLLVFMPFALTFLQAQSGAQESLAKTLWRTIRSPMVIASALGVIVSASGVKLQPLVLAPIEAVAQACVPIMLISYGLSLHGQRVLTTNGTRRDVLLASALNLVAMPLLAWALGAFVFGLAGHQLLIVTTLAALPTAQNVFNLSQRFDTGVVMSRDTIFVTTIGCVPVIILIQLLLG